MGGGAFIIMIRKQHKEQTRKIKIIHEKGSRPMVRVIMITTLRTFGYNTNFSHVRRSILRGYWGSSIEDLFNVLSYPSPMPHRHIYLSCLSGLTIPFRSTSCAICMVISGCRCCSLTNNTAKPKAKAQKFPVHTRM